jgi:predicted AAA+ superfamily ATPase
VKAHFSRQLNLSKTLESRSAFLFGPRGTGKSTLIRNTYPDARYYDLLQEQTYLRLMRDPSVLAQENPSPSQLIIIDEVQKLPKILDEVQRLIFEKQHRFLLTGSSARKLKHSGANLLGGRARELHLFPLVSTEIPDFDLTHFLNRGGLPLVYRSDEPLEDLSSYVSLYLREEIAAEALTRKVDQFSRFLDIMALGNGEELHYQNLSSDSGVPAKTIQNYIEILEDTLLGFKVPPFDRTEKRKPIARSKFYLFDIGITRSLAKRGELALGSELYGRAFEHFIALELRAALDYLRTGADLKYWRTKSGFEVDLIVGSELALEIKATTQVTDRHLKGLRALREEKALKKYWIVSLDSHRRTLDGIEILPWKEFLQILWAGQILA